MRVFESTLLISGLRQWRFSFYVAIFPFISLFYEVVDQLDHKLSMVHLEPSISFLFPSSIGSSVFVDNVSHGYDSQSIWTILLSVVMLLYFTSKGMVMLIRAMNKVENHYESWGYFRNKSVGFGLTMMLLTSIVLLFWSKCLFVTTSLNLSFYSCWSS